MRFMPAATLLLATTLAWGDGPTRQKVTEPVTITPPPEIVWNKNKDFDSIQSWHPAIESSSADKWNAIGSTRTLMLKSSGKIIEVLETYSDVDRKFSYRMKDPGPLPVNNYTSTMSVKPGEA